MNDADSLVEMLREMRSDSRRIEAKVDRALGELRSQRPTSSAHSVEKEGDINPEEDIFGAHHQLSTWVRELKSRTATLEDYVTDNNRRLDRLEALIDALEKRLTAKEQ